MSVKKKLAILGSTGSVGCSTLSVVREHLDKYEVIALTAAKNVEKMLEQCLQFEPHIAVMADEQAAESLASQLQAKGCSTLVQGGQQAIIDVVKNDSISSVMVAIVGGVGLAPSFEAVRQGKQVLIANKEPLVMAGDLFMAAAKESGAMILPIDSEHNAIFQCLPYPKVEKKHIRRLILTASGGPFLGSSWQDLQNVTPAQAIAHPNWSMGPKISVDSATMMNKGLELIEATHLFDMSAERIDVMIHPQSVIHSMVEYIDGSHLAQLGSPDMCIPIAHALAFPERIDSGAKPLDLAKIANLSFQEPNWPEMPCLQLAKEVALQGGAAPIVMNAANEIAVEQFINKTVSFTDIFRLIDTVVGQSNMTKPCSISDVLEIDVQARHDVRALLK